MSQVKLSEVFSPVCKPVRPGVYKTWLYDLFGESVVEGYSYFDKVWFNTQTTPENAKLSYKRCIFGNQNKYWQGILKQ